MIIHYCLRTGFAGCVHEGEFEMPDNASDAEIAEAVNDAAWNYLSLSWWKTERTNLSVR